MAQVRPILDPLRITGLIVCCLQVDGNGPPIWRCLFLEDSQFNYPRPLLYRCHQGDYGQAVCHCQRPSSQSFRARNNWREPHGGISLQSVPPDLGEQLSFIVFLQMTNGVVSGDVHAKF